jgi:hypothetical protein
MVAPEVRSSFGSSCCAAGVLYRQLTPFILAIMATASNELETFPGERPEAGRMKEWLRDNTPKLTNDEVALINSAEPASLIPYRDVTVPPPLTVGGDVTQAMFENRVVTRLAKEDENHTRQATREAKRSEIQSGLFAKLEASMLHSAPLMLDKLKTDHRQTGAFAHLYNGVDACGRLS